MATPIDPSILELNVLEREYTALLNQYQSTYAAYIEHKKDPDKFVALPNKSWWGTAAITGDTVNGQNECMSDCAATEKCSGATFDPKNNYCWIRSGPGTLTSNTSTNAIINVLQNDMRILKTLNAKLLDINKTMHELIEKVNPILTTIKSDESEMKANLTKQSNILAAEEIKLQTMANEYDDLSESYDYQNKYVEQQNLIFKILAILALVASTVVLQKLIIPSWKYIGYLMAFVFGLIIWQQF